jgi:hypothetical protein
MPNIKTVVQRILKLLGGQGSFSQGQCDLDLQPGDLTIKRDHLLFMANLHANMKTVG